MDINASHIFSQLPFLAGLLRELMLIGWFRVLW